MSAYFVFSVIADDSSASFAVFILGLFTKFQTNKEKQTANHLLEKGTSKADENLELLAVRSVGRGGQELLSALGELGNHCGDVLSHGLINVSLQ